MFQQFRIPDRLATQRPDFLIISPPKTGSTWLASNFRCHPQLFVPDIKETKYFSTYLQWFDLDWYLNHFPPADERLKGEASPSYAILPVERIRLIRQLLPDVKIIYLMREPTGRAWSHARHNRRYREANFASSPPEAESVSDEQWQANFTHDWPLASGDYLGQLRRWLSVFPSEQVYVAFYEPIARDPATLLRELFAFLGVDPNIDLASFPLFERILPGTSEELRPSLARFLHRLWHDRTVELASFLETHCDLKPPTEWRTILASDHDSDTDSLLPGPIPAFCREYDDTYLSAVAAQEATFPLAYRPVVGAFLGYRIAFYRGELLALAGSVGPTFPIVGQEERKRLQEQGDCFSAPTLAAVKDRITEHVFDRTHTRIQTLETELRDARSRIDHLDGRLNELRAALRQVEEKALMLSPRESALLNSAREIIRRPLRILRRLTAYLSRVWFRKPEVRKSLAA